MNGTTMEQGYVTLDVVADRCYPAYIDPALPEWNGFVVPYFTAQTAVELLTDLVDAGAVCHFNYAHGNDGRAIQITDVDGTIHHVAPLQAAVDGQLRSLYPVGAMTWAWRPAEPAPVLSEDFIRDRLGGVVDHVLDLGQALVGDELLPHAGIAMDFLTQEGATRVLPQMVLQVQTRLPELRVTAAYAIGGVVIIQVVEA